MVELAYVLIEAIVAGAIAIAVPLLAIGSQVAFNIIDYNGESSQAHLNQLQINIEQTKKEIVKLFEKNEEKAEKQNGYCIIKVNDLSTKHPIFIQFNEVIIPIKGFIKFEKYEEFQVDCVQSTFSNGLSTKNVMCFGDNKYMVLGQTVDLKAFDTCKERIKVTEVTGRSCLRVGVIKDMVFKSRFKHFKLYSACYDTLTNSTIYVHYKLYGKALGPPNLADLYSSNSFHKGHLMPFADAIFPAWREETNYYKNVKPQNSNLNSGVWSTLERAIKIKASETTQTFDVYTGAFDSIEYLDNVNKEVEVHSKWYKMVINGIEGIVFIACNDNPSCSHELDKICTNMCKELNWLTPNARNKIICCSIKNFYNSGKIETIPGTEEVLEHFKMYPWLT